MVLAPSGSGGVHHGPGAGPDVRFAGMATHTGAEPSPSPDRGSGSSARTADHRLIERFIRLDMLGVVAGVALVLVANGFFVKDPLVWLALPILLSLLAVLASARRLAVDGRTAAALVTISAGNMAVALIIPFLFPFLWPVLIGTVLMPLILAIPYLPGRLLMWFITSVALCAGLVATIGLVLDDEGIIDDIDDRFELVLVVSALTVQVSFIGVIAHQNNTIHAASHHELARSRRRIVEAADNERSRIERDLHDGAQQQLVAAAMRLRLLETRLEEDPTLAADVLEVVTHLDGAIDDLRELARGIYPPLLKTRGLPDTLEAACRRIGSPMDIRLEAIGRLDPSAEIAVYYTALEALANAQKHAPGARISLDLRRTGDQVVLAVSDDGPGFELGVGDHQGGLTNIVDRVTSIGGEVAIDTAPGRGTLVTVSL